MENVNQINKVIYGSELTNIPNDTRVYVFNMVFFLYKYFTKSKNVKSSGYFFLIYCIY